MKKNEPQSSANPSANQPKFFHRTIVYTKREDKVVLVDMHDATAKFPLDPWLGRVYLLADGKHTLKELYDFCAKHYKGPSKDLFRTLDSVVERLLEVQAIRLSDTPVKLPYYLSTSADEQDPKLATKMMLEDGYMSSKEAENQTPLIKH